MEKTHSSLQIISVGAALAVLAVTVGCVHLTDAEEKKPSPEEQAFQPKVAMEAAGEGVQKPVETSPDQTRRAKVAIGGRHSHKRKTAVEKLTDKPLLAKVAIEARHERIRKAAVEKLTDTSLLTKVALDAEYQDVITIAVKKLIDQDPDQGFLASLATQAKHWDDVAIRTRVFEQLTEESLLASVAIEARGWRVRKTAFEKLTEEALLAKLAFESPDWQIRKTATEKLTDQALLEHIAIATLDWEVGKTALSRLSPEGLSAVGEATKNPAMRRAAQVRAEEKSWKWVFDNVELEDALGAAALMPRGKAPGPEDVVEACHKYIQEGDATRIPELMELLHQYGDKQLAEDYLNCGQTDLSRSAATWAKTHQYVGRSYRGSPRVVWGSR